MSEVVSLNAKRAELAAEPEAKRAELEAEAEPRIWVCMCGCSTFELLSTSEVRCPVCLTTSEAPDGAWFAPETDGEWDGEPPVRDISGNGSVEFVRHQLSKYAGEEDACAVVVMKRAGSVHAWSMVETAEQLQWFREKLDAAYEITARKFAEAQEEGAESDEKEE